MEKEKPKLDFILNDVYDEITLRNLNSFQILLDTCDYVPEKFLTKFHNDIFKNYKRQRKKAKAEANYRRENPSQEPKEVPVKEEKTVKIITPEMVTISNSNTKKGELTW